MIKKLVLFLLFIGCIQPFMLSEFTSVNAKTIRVLWNRLIKHKQYNRRMPPAPIENLYSLQSEDEFVIIFNDQKFQHFSLSICDSNGSERFHAYYTQSGNSISVPIKGWEQGRYSAIIKMNGEEFGCSFEIDDKE